MTEINTKAIIENYTEAEQKTIKNAMFISLLAGTKAPQTEEEFKNWCESVIENERKEEAEKKAKAEKKALKEAEKAEAMGMTIEEYKEYKKVEAKKKRYIREIEKMEKEIEELKRQIEYRKKAIEKM